MAVIYSNLPRTKKWTSTYRCMCLGFASPFWRRLLAAIYNMIISVKDHQMQILQGTAERKQTCKQQPVNNYYYTFISSKTHLQHSTTSISANIYISMCNEIWILQVFFLYFKYSISVDTWETDIHSYHSKTTLLFSYPEIDLGTKCVVDMEPDQTVLYHPSTGVKDR